MDDEEEFQPQQNEFEFPRDQLFNEILLNILRGHQMPHREDNTFEGLRRVKYDDIIKSLDYEECSICMELFNTDDNEDLIYLP